jgi:hypothetical protein
MVLLSGSLAVGSPLQAKSQAEKDAARIATREKLRAVLEASGPKRGIGISFKQSTKQPFNFVGTCTDGFTNSGGFEVVISVTKDETIGFRVYPYYKGGYINVDKAKDGMALMRQLLTLSDKNFLFWGIDPTGDAFAGYTFTLESGFPDRAIEVVLYSIRPLDKFVGEMRPNVDGTQPSD